MIEFLKEINWLVSLLVGIPLSIVANLLTPKLQNWLAKRSMQKSKKRITLINLEYKKIDFLKKNKDILLMDTLKVILEVIIFIGIGNAVTSIPFIYVIADPIGAIFYFIGIKLGLSHLTIISNVKNFDKFMENIEIQKKSLENTNDKVESPNKTQEEEQV